MVLAMADDPVQGVLIEAGQRQSGATVAAPIETESAAAGDEEGESVAPFVHDDTSVQDIPDAQLGETLQDQPAPASTGKKDVDAATSMSNSFPFPLTRIRNIIKLDKDIKVVARPALVAIAYASQQFIESLTSTAFSEMIKGKRKSLRLSHLEAAVRQKREFLNFLEDSMDVFAEKKDDSTEEEGEGDDPRGPKKRQLDPPPPGTRCITDFFGSLQSGQAASGEETLASSSSGSRQQQEEIECQD